MRTDLILELGVLRLPLAFLVLVLATHHLELLLELRVLQNQKTGASRHARSVGRSIGRSDVGIM